MLAVPLLLVDVLLLTSTDTLHIPTLNADADSLITVMSTAALILSTTYVDVLSAVLLTVIIVIYSTLNESVALIAWVIG